MSGVLGSIWVCGGSLAWLILSLIVIIGGGVNSIFGRFHLTVSFLCFVWLISKSKGRSGGFFGGPMLLGSNLKSQFDFLLLSFLHFVRYVRNAAQLSLEILLFVMWLINLEQLS